MTVKTNKLSAALFLRLYTSVVWEPPGIEQVQKALENTIATFTAYDGDTPVGMVRLLGGVDAAENKSIQINEVLPLFDNRCLALLLENSYNLDRKGDRR